MVIALGIAESLQVLLFKKMGTTPMVWAEHVRYMHSHLDKCRGTCKAAVYMIGPGVALWSPKQHV